jgi:hypothetical protein
MRTSGAGRHRSQRRNAATISGNERRSGPATSSAIRAGAPIRDSATIVATSSSSCTTCIGPASGTSSMTGNAARPRNSALPP